MYKLTIYLEGSFSYAINHDHELWKDLDKVIEFVKEFMTLYYEMGSVHFNAFFEKNRRNCDAAKKLATFMKDSEMNLVVKIKHNRKYFDGVNWQKVKVDDYSNYPKRRRGTIPNTRRQLEKFTI